MSTPNDLPIVSVKNCKSPNIYIKLNYIFALNCLNKLRQIELISTITKFIITAT